MFKNSLTIRSTGPIAACRNSPVSSNVVAGILEFLPQGGEHGLDRAGDGGVGSVHAVLLHPQQVLDPGLCIPPELQVVRGRRGD